MIRLLTKHIVTIGKIRSWTFIQQNSGKQQKINTSLCRLYKIQLQTRNLLKPSHKATAISAAFATYNWNQSLQNTLVQSSIDIIRRSPINISQFRNILSRRTSLGQKSNFAYRKGSRNRQHNRFCNNKSSPTSYYSPNHNL